MGKPRTFTKKICGIMDSGIYMDIVMAIKNLIIINARI